MVFPHTTNKEAIRQRKLYPNRMKDYIQTMWLHVIH